MRFYKKAINVQVNFISQVVIPRDKVQYIRVIWVLNANVHWLKRKQLEMSQKQVTNQHLQNN